MVKVETMLQNAKRVEWLYTPALSGSKMGLSFGVQKVASNPSLRPQRLVPTEVFWALRSAFG